MHTIRALSKRFGLSERQVNYRLDNAHTLLNNHIHIGRHNARMLDSSGLQVFDRLIQVERDYNLNVEQAVDHLSSEMKESHQNRVESSVEDHVEGRRPDGNLHDYIKHLEDEVTWYRQRIEQLEDRIDDLQQLALPNPDRRAWWHRLLRINQS